MHYEERYDNGVWYWRSTPDGGWVMMGKHQLAEKLAAAQRELAAYREPTIEDAWELDNAIEGMRSRALLYKRTMDALKQLGFVRKSSTRYEEILSE